jgi:hypothetical protein
MMTYYSRTNFNYNRTTSKQDRHTSKHPHLLSLHNQGIQPNTPTTSTIMTYATG